MRRLLIALAMLATTPFVLAVVLVFWAAGVVGVLIGTHEFTWADRTIRIERP